MAIELVTGHAGEGHVSSADFGRFNAGICGTAKYVLKTGSKFAYTIVSANEISIASGDAVNQGRHIIIPQNTTESAAIQNGTTGKTRIDVIALRYFKVTDNGNTTEGASLVVIKGTEVNKGSTPSVPAVTSGNIFNGAVTDDMPLYNVLITDTNITSVTKVFKEIAPLSDIASLIYPVGSIYISVSSTNPGTLFGGTWAEIQGKFLLGRDSGHAAGATGGAETVTLTKDQIPSHTHTGPSHTHSVPNHTHGVPKHGHTASTASAGSHTHNVHRIKAGGSGSARYAAQSAATGYTGETYATTSAGSHTHTVTVADKAAFNTTSSGSCTTGSAGTGATGATGGGGAHTNMPPYLAVYIWKRTA